MEADGFARIPAGSFVMGSDDGPHAEDGEGPAREVWLDAYDIAKTSVSVSEFEVFIGATGYVTVAERQGWSLVFAGQLTDPERHPVADPAVPWWRRVEGACWQRPNGRCRSLDDLPAVHIAYADVLAYCAWAGCRLPTEAEWERAAPWPEGALPRIWSGRFPDAPDGRPDPLAVDEAPANSFGLKHACGNVWEWTQDRFSRLHSPRPARNPKGPLNGDMRVVKGGSFLCCPSYCARFRPSSRRAELPGATTSHLGFRVAGSFAD